MRFVNPLPFVADVDRALGFYRDLLGLRVQHNHGDFVQFEHGFALHEGTSLKKTVFGSSPATDRPYGRDNLVLYFEETDLDRLFERIAEKVDVIHGIEEQAWGQRVFRVRDPDGHIVEVGEPQAGAA